MASSDIPPPGASEADGAGPASGALDLAGEDGRPRRLKVGDVVAVARRQRPVAPLVVDPGGQRPLEQEMVASRAWVESEVAAEAAGECRAVYGINTGFGALAGRRAFQSAYLSRVLSWNLLVSHAAGAGEVLPEDVVRATAFIRSHQLAQGRSGVRVEVVNRLLAILNAGVYPIIPSMGSLGASGDLAPLAHLALVIARPPVSGPGDPEVPVADAVADVWAPVAVGAGGGAAPGDAPRRKVDARTAMAPLGGQIELGAKEGLALNNGATVSAALLALAVADAEILLDHAELAVAMSLEAAMGFRDAFLPEVMAARPHPGAALAARRILEYVAGSTLLDPASRDLDPVRVPPQDPYSLRCAPQVLGAARDAVAFTRRTAETEINSAVDNPLVMLDLPRSYKTVSCGNFHGAPVGYALDLLKIVVTDVASMSERRIFKLIDYRFDDAPRRDIGLPLFLASSPPDLEGLNSGLMIPQYTAAALVSASKTLAHPDSVDSIPSSAGQEDHVSMSMNAGLHARTILDRCRTVLAAIDPEAVPGVKTVA
ncbi:MAG: histidine ammonia-lyase, partial [Anaerolineae bacterium]